MRGGRGRGLDVIGYSLKYIYTWSLSTTPVMIIDKNIQILQFTELNFLDRFVRNLIILL